MRINKWIAQHTEFSRRKVDELIANGDIRVNDSVAVIGQEVSGEEIITIQQKRIEVQTFTPITLLLHKPWGYVCSREGQGNKTIYDLLPQTYYHLNIAGRLDKDSSGLVILSNDGKVIQDLSHPSKQKEKVYIITTNTLLSETQLHDIQTKGINIGDKRPSRFSIIPMEDSPYSYKATLQEGRNRQIRRTFEVLHKHIESLHRIQIGKYELRDLPEGKFIIVPNK